MKKSFQFSALVVVLFLLSTLNASAQSEADRMARLTDRWFKAQQYLGGLKLVPAESTNKAEFEHQYKANQALWDKAFAYLKNTDLDKLPVGKYPIAGDSLFASVTDNPTKVYEQTVWESHRKYIDLQYVAQGAEGMAVANVASAKVTEPYNPAKDVAHYETTGTQYDAKPGTFYLFFPQDAHRVNIKVDGAEHDKKIVLKILYAQ